MCLISSKNGETGRDGARVSKVLLYESPSETLTFVVLVGIWLVGKAGYSSFLHTCLSGSSGSSFSASKWKELLDNTDRDESSECTEDDEVGRRLYLEDVGDPTILTTESPNALGV